MNEAMIQCEIAVIGAGPAGIAAACAAAETSRNVVVLDQAPWFGGQNWHGQQARLDSRDASKWFNRFERSGARFLGGTTVIASPAQGVLLAETAGEPRQIRWERLILATGARELLLPFPGWTLPGVFGAGGLQTLVKSGWPVEGKRVVVAGSGPLLLAVAAGLREHGARVTCIAEQSSRLAVARFGLRLVGHLDKLFQGLRLRLGLMNVPYRFGTRPVAAEGDGQVRQLTLRNAEGVWTEDCDLVACGFGLVPNVELPLALGCELAGGFVRVDGRQSTSVADIYCAGEPTGIGGTDCALVEGQIAGYAATGQDARAQALTGKRASWHRFREQLATAFRLRAELKSMAAADTIVCRCEDVPLARIQKFSGWREAKLQSRCGMGSCQGRVCGSALNVIFNWQMQSVRPPLFPSRVASLIGDQFGQSEPLKKSSNPIPPPVHCSID